MRDYRRKSNRKAGGMITSISRVGQMFPKASASTIPRGFSAMTADAPNSFSTTPAHAPVVFPVIGLTPAQQAVAAIAKDALKAGQLEAQNKQKFTYSQLKLVRKLFNIYESEGPEAAANALSNGKEYSDILKFLKNEVILPDEKTIKWMNEILTPAHFRDFLKKFVFFWQTII